MTYTQGIRLTVQELMDRTGVRFGTSGARGLASEMTDLVCYVYTRGFLQYLEATGELRREDEPVAVAGDLRPSTDRIVTAVAAAIEDGGYRACWCGTIPSPAVAHYALSRRIPSIMVTGSHIPADRNGIKFNKCHGELLKDDEPGIQRQIVRVEAGRFGDAGDLVPSGRLQRVPDPAARRAYHSRYLDCLPRDALRGIRLGFYQHSAVGRELLPELLQQLGARVVTLGFSEEFVPVDTEAIRQEDVVLARRWAEGDEFDALVSTDGDSDRPLVSDERGRWLRGDVAGILCASFLGADSVSVPVSCNTAVEKCGRFAEVRRTRIGSPYVVSSMMKATAGGATRVVGYEANGGFLTNSPIPLGHGMLSPLPTRDAVILMLGVLLLVKEKGRLISALVDELPRRFTASDRLRDFPADRSRAILHRLGGEGRPSAIAEVFGSVCGEVSSLDRTDGLRMTFRNGEIVHLRPSGNAPEFRCYTEAATEERAEELNRRCLDRIRGLNG